MSLAIHLRKMARNNAWANHRLLTACAALSDEAFRQQRTSFFPSLHATLNHNLAVDLYYIDALEEAGLGPKAFTAYTPLAAPELLDAQAATDRQLIAFCDRQTESDLARSVITDRGDRGRVGERVDDMLAHLFQHQIHHRGQAHAMLSGTNVDPPQLDEYFLRFDAQRCRADLIGLAIEAPEAVT